MPRRSRSVLLNPQHSAFICSQARRQQKLLRPKTDRITHLLMSSTSTSRAADDPLVQLHLYLARPDNHRVQKRKQNESKRKQKQMRNHKMTTRESTTTASDKLRKNCVECEEPSLPHRCLAPARQKTRSWRRAVIMIGTFTSQDIMLHDDWRLTL